jgi:hypothetical protein
MVQDLPLLKYGSNANFEQFKRAIANYAEREYPSLSSIFTVGEYVEPPPIIVSDAEDAAYRPEQLSQKNDPYGILKAQVQEEVRERVKKINIMQDKKKSLFAVIWGQLSPESEQIVMQHEYWAEFIADHSDPLKLWQAVEDTHVIAATGIALLDKRKARRNYDSLRQDPDETLVRFKERTDAAVHAMMAYGADSPPDQDQAMDFVERLDKSRYERFQLKMKDLLLFHNGEGYPANLTEAYNKAAVFIPDRSSKSFAVQRTSQSVFFAESQTSKKYVHKGGKQQEARRVTNKKPMKGGRNGNCLICEAEDHWAKDCPHRERVRNFVRGGAEVTAATMTVDQDDHHDEIEYAVNLTAIGNEVADVPPHIAAPCHASASIGKFEVLLDNQATKSGYKEARLLRNIRTMDATVRFVGIGGSETTNQAGDFQDFGTVSYMPQALANILSFAEIQDRGNKIGYNPEIGFTVTAKNGQSVTARRS